MKRSWWLRLDAFQKELGIKVERVDLKFLKG